MKTIIYTNINSSVKKKNKYLQLIIGIILVIVAFIELLTDSKSILKLITAIIPIILIINAIKIFKIASHIKKDERRHFRILLLQAIILIISAIYIILHPIQSLNYIIIIAGILLIINNINQMMISTNKYYSFGSFLLSILCILFSNQIIDTFYTLFLIIIGIIGIYKIGAFFSNSKNKFIF